MASKTIFDAAMWTDKDRQLYHLVQEWSKAESESLRQSVLGRQNYVLEVSILRATQYKAIFYGVKIFLLSQAFKNFPPLFLCYVSRTSNLEIPETVHGFDLQWYRTKATFSQKYWMFDILKTAWIAFDGFNVP